MSSAENHEILVSSQPESGRVINELGNVINMAGAFTADSNGDLAVRAVLST